MNDTPVTPETTEEVITLTTKIKQIAKRAILPVIAVAGVVGTIVLTSHGKRIDELEDDVDELALEFVSGDDDDIVEGELVVED